MLLLYTRCSHWEVTLIKVCVVYHFRHTEILTERLPMEGTVIFIYSITLANKYIPSISLCRNMVWNSNSINLVFFAAAAAELHILTLMEHMKPQQSQLPATVNSLDGRMENNLPQPDDDLEQWLQDGTNARIKTQHS